jgi:hypothetical protein
MPAYTLNAMRPESRSVLITVVIRRLGNWAKYFEHSLYSIASEYKLMEGLITVSKMHKNNNQPPTLMYRISSGLEVKEESAGW